MSTITFSGSTPQSFPQALLEEEVTTSGDLEQAEKLVVDDVVHIDHDHATDIIRIELTNDTKVPLVVNNTAHSPKKVFHIRPTGSIHTTSSVYAKVLHAELHDGTQINVVDHFDSEVTDLQTDVEDLLDNVDEATHLDNGSGKVVKRDSANMTVINNLIVKADESNRSTALYPPPGLLFDKAICETSLTCVDNAQVIFQPYNSSGAEITGRSYQFGRAEDADDEKDGLHFQDITNAQDHMRVRLNVGKTQPSLLLVGKKNLGVPMFEIRNHNGDTMFAVDEEGGVVYKGHGTGTHTNESHQGSIALNDNSLYIGSTRFSFDRANGELVMHVIARVPAYLTALGYSLSSPAVYTDHSVHDYCKFARDLASNQRLKISDVFPFATTADWTLYVSEATRNINTNIATHLTPMVNPQAYRNVDYTVLDDENETAQVADDTWLQVIEHDNLAGIIVYLPEDPESQQVCRVKNLNTSGDESIIVALTAAAIAAGTTIDHRFTSVQLNASTSTSSPDTTTNQCSTMIYLEPAAGNVWARIGDGY